ncbi:hypothetical protein PLCT2_02268 [Planctomycetaceae bacterium]|nr:hypothetical protein PLCT2_02268 [Planctomycetaceae bacterium]
MEFTALLVVEFDVSVDGVSREMFAERLLQLNWVRDSSVRCAWNMEFERSSHDSAMRSAKTCLDLACGRARINRNQISALIHFGPGGPIQVGTA